MSKKFSIAVAFGQVIGVASTIFMVWVFYNESLRGLGVLYYEPNQALAGIELAMATVGLVIQALVLTLMSLGSKKAKPETNGFPKSGVPYQ